MSWEFPPCENGEEWEIRYVPWGKTLEKLDWPRGHANVALLGDQIGSFDEGPLTTSPEQQDRPAHLGWRFGIGVALMVGGYAAWSLIPVAVMTDLHPAIKSALTGLLGATPFLTKIAAVALMGRPAYNFFKRSVANYVWTGRADR
jgi:hypothetical protein